MNKQYIFKYIKAANFFPLYAPQVSQWKRKTGRRNGRGHTIDFTEQDHADIKAGVEKLFKDLFGG